ncbi:AfsR/SARP family transcriptional regulator [Amycolatopsis suaedae]|nr:AfsR/SARP family transcriptional regulator [Amycolatopsis suaedae]
MDAPVAIRGTKRRVLLARLLFDRGRAVPVDRLLDALWPTRPPRSAVANLQQYVHDIRRLLISAGSRATIVTSGGYRIEVPAGELDVEVFEQGLDRARGLRAAGDPVAASGLVADLLGLVRGEPVEDLPTAGIDDAELTRLGELVLCAKELKVDLDLTLGDSDKALATLRQLLARYPFHEPLWKQLMLALCAQGRPTEALRAFAALRRQLVEELGVEPGDELRAVHEAILRGNTAQRRCGCGRVSVPLRAAPQRDR